MDRRGSVGRGRRERKRELGLSVLSIDTYFKPLYILSLSFKIENWRSCNHFKFNLIIQNISVTEWGGWDRFDAVVSRGRGLFWCRVDGLNRCFECILVLFQEWCDRVLASISKGNSVKIWLISWYNAWITNTLKCILTYQIGNFQIYVLL